jgi:hypothetical protein
MDKRIKETSIFGLGNVNTNKESVSEIESVSDYSYNEIVIKRKKPNDYYMPMTYRLKVSTIEQIRKQAKNADMGVAEYLQSVLDAVLDKIEIKE